MTKDELRDIMDSIANVYPFFMPQDIAQCKNKLMIWYEALRDQNYTHVKSKLIDWIKQNDKAPTPCELIEADWREEYEIA